MPRGNDIVHWKGSTETSLCRIWKPQIPLYKYTGSRVREHPQHPRWVVVLELVTIVHILETYIVVIVLYIELEASHAFSRWSIARFLYLVRFISYNERV